MKITSNANLHANTLTMALGPNYHMSGFLGLCRLGELLLGRVVALDPRFGIYQTRPTRTGRVQVFEPFYRPSNPRTTAQQAQRAKMTAGVSAWHALDSYSQSWYNKRAEKKSMTGFNLFLSDYLLTH